MEHLCQQCSASQSTSQTTSELPLEEAFELPDESEWENSPAKPPDLGPDACVMPQQDLRVGDVILSLGRDGKVPFSKSIAKQTKSGYSHSALYIGRGEVIEATVVAGEKGKDGLVRRGVARSIADDEYAHVFRIKTSFGPDDARRLRAVACSVWQEQQRDPTSHRFDVAGMVVQGGMRLGKPTLEKFYCSEYILHVYQKAGVPFPTDPRGSPGEMSRVMVYAGTLKFSKADNKRLASGKIGRCAVRTPDAESVLDVSACGAAQKEFEIEDEFEFEDFDRYQELEAPPPQVSNTKEALALCSDARTRRVFFKKLLKLRIPKTLPQLAVLILKALAREASMSATYPSKLAYLMGASYAVVVRARNEGPTPIRRPPTRFLPEDKSAWLKGFDSAYQQGRKLGAQVDVGAMNAQEAVNTVFALFVVEAFCDEGGARWGQAMGIAGGLKWPAE